jgi:membrane dipeptidase
LQKIVDAHNDLLLELAFRSAEPRPFENYWLGPLREGGLKVQVCPVSAQWEVLPEGALRQALEQTNACFRALAEHPDELALIQTKEDLEAVLSSEHLGLMLSMEGAEPLGYSPELADVFWQLGFRMFALTWNRRNPFADGNGEDPKGGLSRLGGMLIDRLVRLGAIIDLAHANAGTYADVLERAAGAQIIVSHSACRAVCDTPRNQTDDQLRALAEAGGIFGIMAIPWVIDAQEPTVERVVDHIDHAIEVVGIEHVGLGGDFFSQVALSGAVRKPPDSARPPGMGLEVGIEGLTGPEYYPNLVKALEARGYEQDALDALVRDNWLRVFASALPSETKVSV